MLQELRVFFAEIFSPSARRTVVMGVVVVTGTVGFVAAIVTLAREFGWEFFAAAAVWGVIFLLALLSLFVHIQSYRAWRRAKKRAEMMEGFASKFEALFQDNLETMKVTIDAAVGMEGRVKALEERLGIPRPTPPAAPHRSTPDS